MTRVIDRSRYRSRDHAIDRDHAISISRTRPYVRTCDRVTSSVRAHRRHFEDVTDEDDVVRDANECVYPGPCRGVQEHVRIVVTVSSSLYASSSPFAYAPWMAIDRLMRMTRKAGNLFALGLVGRAVAW